MATTTALTAVENKIPKVSNLVKNTVYNTNTTEIENKIATDLDHDRYSNNRKFNKLISKTFNVRLKQAKMISLISQKRQILKIN